MEFLAEPAEHLSLFYIKNSTKFLRKTVLAEPAEPKMEEGDRDTYSPSIVHGYIHIHGECGNS